MDADSSYDDNGNPIVGGRHDRNGNLKQKYIINAQTETNVVEEVESSAYDSDGNPAPIEIGVKINRKLYKYDKNGRKKKRKKKEANIRL